METILVMKGMTITETAQFTEYPKGGFYNWHIDADMNCQNEPPVRKISMDYSAFESI